MIVAHKHYGSFKQGGGIVEMLKDMGSEYAVVRQMWEPCQLLYAIKK